MLVLLQYFDLSRIYYYTHVIPERFTCSRFLSQVLHQFLPNFGTWMYLLPFSSFIFSNFIITQGHFQVSEKSYFFIPLRDVFKNWNLKDELRRKLEYTCKHNYVQIYFGTSQFRIQPRNMYTSKWANHRISFSTMCMKNTGNSST